jgi:hypothetical protein
MHEAALKTIEVFFGRVLTSDEALAEMQEQHEANPVVAVAS